MNAITDVWTSLTTSIAAIPANAIDFASDHPAIAGAMGAYVLLSVAAIRLITTRTR